MGTKEAEKKAYNNEVKDIKKEILQNRNKIKELKMKSLKNKKLEGYFGIESAVLHMKNIRDILEMNKLSVSILDMKQSSILDDAKKELSNLIIVMETILGNDIDRPLKENDDYLARIDQVSPRQALSMMKSIYGLYDNLKTEFGEGSKWKWIFVEMQARIAIISKNFISFSDIQKYKDPREEFFYDRRDLMQFCKDNITKAAKDYRQKYEMGGKARDDLKKSIELLEALRNIHSIMGERDDAIKLKNTIDAGRQALESEDKSSDEKKKK